MLQVKISDFKSHLSEHIRSVRRGGVVVVMDRYLPVASLVPYVGPKGGLELISATKKNPKDLQHLKKTKLKKTVDVLEILTQERADR